MDQPARIGRFVVLRKLGQGAMGVVFAAYDEELERKLAIKLLLPRLRSERQSVGEARLLREAQVLARLSHPNVVQIYEVGSVGEAVYIAMELVHGKSLGEWLAVRPRSWRDILGAFLQAGAGLAAAHAAGVIHRDIKPDNLLVGDDGRVRVLDFSLARAPMPGPNETGEHDSPGEPGLTRAGALVGTPLYMSPEQLQGLPADARSDQFSFFSTLHLSQPPAARKQGQTREIAGLNSPTIWRANPQDTPAGLPGFGENQETEPGGPGGACVTTQPVGDRTGGCAPTRFRSRPCVAATLITPPKTTASVGHHQADASLARATG